MSLVKFDKTECGADFLMKFASPKELVRSIFDTTSFRSDLFEVFYSKKEMESSS